MRALTIKDGDLISHLDNINGGITLAEFISTPFKRILNENYTEPAKKGKIKGQLPLEHVYGFCKTFKKIAKNLEFHLTLETNDPQNIIFTTIAADVIVTFNSLKLFVPILIPDTETQVMFNESNKNNYTITYVSWYTERKLSTNGFELQVINGSAQHSNSPKYLIGAFQTADRIAAPNKNINIAISDKVNVRKSF